MGIYDSMGVRRVINCFDTYTLAGGHLLEGDVKKAMDEADSKFAFLLELEEKAGKRIAELIGVEAAWVTPGAFAGLAMGAAACMTGKDPDKMRKLPDTSGMKNEILIQRCLRDFKYDRSMTVAGGKLVEVGDSVKGCTSEQLEGAVTSKTVAFHYMAHGPTGALTSKNCKFVSLEDAIEIGKKHDIPVLVDAAYQCYPLENFRKFVDMGASLTAYSCKYFGGPNTAGLVLGTRDLIESVAMHSFVGQEGMPEDKLYLGAKEPKYHGSIFRGYKLDRSSIVGAVSALEWYLKTDHVKTLDHAHERLNRFIGELKPLPRITMTPLDSRVEGIDPLRVALQLTLEDRTVAEAESIANELLRGDPAIWLEASGNNLIIGITSFRGLMLFGDEEEKIVVDKLRNAISKLK